MAIAMATFNRFRSGIDRNPVGNLGFSLFSADAFSPAFLVGAAQQVDHLQTMWVQGMIDVLIDGFVVYGVPRMLDPYSPGDLLWGPSFFEASSHILPDEFIFESLARVRQGLSFTGPGMCPAGRIASTLRWRVPLEFSADRGFITTMTLAISPRLLPSESS